MKTLQTKKLKLGNTTTSYIKVTAALVMLFGIAFGLSSIGSTVSYFNDTEISPANTFNAGLVDITVARMSVPASLPDPVGTDSFTLDIEPGSGSLPFNYAGRVVQDGVSDPSCSNIVIDAWLGALHYTGTLATFVLPDTAPLGMWLFVLTVPEGAVLPDALCGGDLVFDAWASGLPNPATKIFTDSAVYHFSIKSQPAPQVSAALPDTIVPPTEPVVE